MIDKYCRKSGPLRYKEELTPYHVSISFFMKLECLKLDLHNKLEFQKSGILLLILQIVVCCKSFPRKVVNCRFGLAFIVSLDY